MSGLRGGGGPGARVRRLARWSVMHGLIRAHSWQGLRADDPQARLIADPRVRMNPLPLYDRLRAEGPLVRARIVDMSVDHALVNEVLRSDDFRTIVFAENLPGPLRRVEKWTRTDALHPLAPPSLLSVEPPSHTTYRKLVSSVFTARAVTSMREGVQQVADDLLDRLQAQGSDTVEIIDAYCSKLPVAVISDILGVPPQDRGRILQFGEWAAPSLDSGLPWRQYRDADRGLAAFDEWLGRHIASLRRTPGDDLMSRLIGASDNGVHLSDQELRSTAGLVLAAGFETTVNLLGSGISLLMEHPDQLRILREDPSHWPTAVDEMLRVASPVQVTGRVARRTTTLAGRTVERGRTVVCVLAGANLDPEVFPDPGRFDVTRANAARHLAFSGGRHFCLGAALARAESEVGLKTLFDRFPDIAPAGPGVRRPTRVLRGYKSLPVHLGSPSPVRSPA